jgi:hypothetical protein
VFKETGLLRPPDAVGTDRVIALPRTAAARTAKSVARALAAYRARHRHQLPCEILADDLIDTHYWLREKAGVAPRTWNAVAPHLRALTGGRKVYGWFERHGAMHRLRVYPLPSACLASTPEPMSVAAPRRFRPHRTPVQTPT